MADDLCLLQIHAHPDDEASKGAGTSAKYAAEGVRNVLVCCTGGEEGDILNPAMERPEVRADLAGVRMAELDASARAIGYASVQMLGYRDSGMPDTEANARPDNFANAPLDEAVERFVKIIRAERPQVIITYHEDRNWYPHPDHIRVWEISGPAFDAAGDPDRFPDAGEPWQPSKLYYVAWSMARVKALHAVYTERGQESPFARWFEGDNKMPDRDERFTTRIDVSEHLGARRAALLAHATQVDPNGHWMAIPDELVREVYPWEDYILERSLVPGTVPEGGFEDDLFAGLREPARRAR
jgi:mycothiol S-conjugate amidase